MQKNKRMLILFGVLIIMAMVIAPAAAQQPGADQNRINAPDSGLSSRIDPNAGGVYIIRLGDPAVASYTGGIAGLDATSPTVTGARKLDVDSPASQAYREYLEGRHDTVVVSMEAALGRSVKVLYRFLNVYNGMSVEMTGAEAALVAGLPGVVSIQLEEKVALDTDVGPSWIGAPGVWAGNNADDVGTKGEGVIIGVLDTGINSTHPSFADIGGDGYNHSNPFGAGVYVGVCDSGDPSFQPAFACNDKLIGAWTFTGEVVSPEDTDGHGSHTASTAGGNHIFQTMTAITGIEISDDLSGVAPHANIISYDVCDEGGCFNIVAAIDQAVADGVDVINYSISGGGNPWSSAVELAYLDAYNAGVVVSESAGNDGPGAGSTNKNAPWVMNVAATTHNRAMFNNVVNMTGGNTTPPADIAGLGFTFGYGPASIVYAGDYPSTETATPELCGVGALGDENSPWDPGTFNGEIVVCDRGTFGRVEKGHNVLTAGAGGFILVDNGAGLVLDEHELPGSHISMADGTVLKAWLATGTGHMATLTGGALDYSVSNADVMAGFSSRGPGLYNMITPDLGTPGVGIWAAYCKDCTNSSPDTSFLSGTSMAAPHNTGAAALMVALHPDWTPAMIKSAMASTAYSSDVIVKEDGVTPADAFDTGAGRVDVTAASNAGFVLLETGADFLAADPGSAGDPRTLNVASMMDSGCVTTCVFTRTISSTLSTSVDWTVSVDNPDGVDMTVSPDSFTLPAFGTQVLVFTADTTSAALDSWLFGNVWFTPDSNIQFLSLVVKNTSASEPGGSPAPSYFGPSVQHFPFVLAVPPADISINPTSLSATLPTDDSTTKVMTISNVGTGSLDWTIVEDALGAPSGGWDEDWDSYATDFDVHGTNGWKGWGGDTGASASTTDDESLSAPNSIDINGGSDLVREYTGYDSGVWVYSTWVYIPGDFSGDSSFILLNQYDDPGSTNNWSTQVHFNSSTGLLSNDGASGGSTTYLTDQWVEIRVEINLDNDTQLFFYNGALLYSGTWTDEVSGGGILAIGAVDLFANGASSVYYDDLSLTAGTPTCTVADDMPWLSVSPTAGSTGGGDSDDVDVDFDSTGLSEGTYGGFLCVNSNDPDESTVIVPVSMEVVSDLPNIVVDPASVVSTQATNTVVTETLTISNTGVGDLTWSIDEENTTSGLSSDTPVVPNVDPSLLAETVNVLGVPAPASGDTPVLYSPSGGVLYDNGPLLTHPGGGFGGDDASRLQNISLSMCITGFGHAQGTGFRVADEFTVTDGEGWTVDEITFYAYQTGSTTTSSMNFLTLRIWDGKPGAGGSVIWGDTTTNVLGGTGYTSMYRDAESTPAVSTRPLMASSATVGTFLPAGTYWLDWATGGTLASGPWAPPITITGLDTTGNGLQWNGSAWSDAIDAGTGCGSLTPQGFPFTVTGTTGGTPDACTVLSDMPWLSLSPDNGVTGAGGATDVALTFDSTGLSDGTYTGNLCVNSDDPDEPLVTVPVSLDVGEVVAPEITVDPTSMSSTQSGNTTVMQTLTISNTGTGTLDWDIDEDNSPSAAPDYSGSAVPGADFATSGLTGESVTPVSSFDDPNLVVLTHSTSQAITPANSVACSGDGGATTTDNQYLRTFDLNSFGITGDFAVTAVEFGVESATSPGAVGQPITVNLYEWDGVSALTYANLSLVGTTSTTLADTSLTLQSVGVTGTVGAGMVLVVEVANPDGSGVNAFFIGSNNAGQSAPSYLASTSCGLANPTNVTNIGNPQMMIVINVTGDEGSGSSSCDAADDIPWLSLDTTSGSTAGGAGSDVVVTYDSTGLANGTYSASLCINSNDATDPTTEVPVTLTVTGH